MDAKQSNLEAGLPGEDLIVEGLADLAESRLTDFSLLLLIAAPRLRRLGFDIPHAPFSDPPEHRLYDRLAARLGNAAHSR